MSDTSEERRRLRGRRGLRTHVSVCQRNGLHQVDSFGVNLDEGEDVPGLHRVAQRVEPGGGVGALPASEALFGVLGGDEILPRLPDGRFAALSVVDFNCKDVFTPHSTFGLICIIPHD